MQGVAVAREVRHKIIQHRQALGKFMEELSKQNYIQFPLMATIKQQSAKVKPEKSRPADQKPKALRRELREKCQTCPRSSLATPVSSSSRLLFFWQVSKLFEVLLVLHIEAYVEIYLYDACGAALSPIRHKSAELIEHERAGQAQAD